MENNIFTSTHEFKERFHRLVQKGRRSELIVELLTAELNKRDQATSAALMVDVYLKENIVPILDKAYSNGMEYKLIEYMEEFETYKGNLRDKLKRAEAPEITDEHLYRSLRLLINAKREKAGYRPV